MRRFRWAALAWLTCFLMVSCGGGAVGPTSNQDGDLDGVNADSDLHADLDHEDTSQEQAEDSPDSEIPSDGDESQPDGDTEAELDTPLDGDIDEPNPTDGDTDLPTESDIAGCTAGAAQCTLDGYGFETCGLDPDAGVNSFGPRIPCAPNQECQNGVCNRDGCLESEVLFLLDRSASMNQSGAWAWVKPAFTAALDERDHVNYFGFRQFPQGECTAGAVVPLAKNNAATIAAAIANPTVASATPIADALQGLALDFGDPNDGQAVVLITDGEETCDTQADAVQAASTLFRAGVRVYVVAVTTTANRTFLNQLAQVGGTGESRLVRDGEEFAVVLDSVMIEVGARRCAPDNVCCEADGCALADPSVVCAAYADTCNAAACNEAAMACFADPIQSQTCAHLVRAVSTGDSHTCVLTASGGVKCWGDNRYGQLGDETNIDRTSPVDVSGLTSGVTAISAGGSHTCALLSNSGVKCWGGNSFGQIGDGTNSAHSSPVDVSGLTSGVATVSVGTNHTCAVLSAGGLKCWGYNQDGQLGNGTTTNKTIPTDVSNMSSGVKSVSLGYGHTCALLTSGAVKCWGSDSQGQLGTGSWHSFNVPVSVSALSSGVAAISLGDFHSCALTGAGGLKCWGNNAYGQLGNGTTTHHATPGDVDGLTSGVTGMSTGGSHSCALTNADGLKCWGDNELGQLGDGTWINRSTPVSVSNLTSGVESVAGGYYHTCAIVASGSLKCWGYNSDSQLGDGTTTNRNTPVDLVW